jgi:hypothetical protein
VQLDRSCDNSRVVRLLYVSASCVEHSTTLQLTAIPPPELLHITATSVSIGPAVQQV